MKAPLPSLAHRASRQHGPSWGTVACRPPVQRAREPDRRFAHFDYRHTGPLRGKQALAEAHARPTQSPAKQADDVGRRAAKAGTRKAVFLADAHELETLYAIHAASSRGHYRCMLFTPSSRRLCHRIPANNSNNRLPAQARCGDKLLAELLVIGCYQQLGTGREIYVVIRYKSCVIRYKSCVIEPRYRP
jgi:hypothetical protein